MKEPVLEVKAGAILTAFRQTRKIFSSLLPPPPACAHAALRPPALCSNPFVQTSGQQGLEFSVLTSAEMRVTHDACAVYEGERRHPRRPVKVLRALVHGHAGAELQPVFLNNAPHQIEFFGLGRSRVAAREVMARQSDDLQPARAVLFV
jgi:hypothetical protein